MEQKLFTVEEAEELLSRVAPLVRTISDNRRAMHHLANELISLQEQAREDASKVDGSTLVNRQTELDFLATIVNESLESIENMGVLMKDLDAGLIDFPSVIDGEPVLLCWKLGEEAIGYYHNYEEGFAGRKPLSRSKA